MHEQAGIALLVGGTAVGLPAAFLLRTRAPAAVVTAILAACGLALGAGALLVQDHASAADWVLTLALMTFLIPAHVRIVLGPFGPRAPA